MQDSESSTFKDRRSIAVLRCITCGQRNSHGEIKRRWVIGLCYRGFIHAIDPRGVCTAVLSLQRGWRLVSSLAAVKKPYAVADARFAGNEDISRLSARVVPTTNAVSRRRACRIGLLMENVV